MTPIFTFEGLYSPTITPYMPSGISKHAVQADLMEHQFDAGLHGTISSGSVGGNYARDHENRHSRARFTKERVAGSPPLVRMLQQGGKAAQHINHRLTKAGRALCGMVPSTLEKPKLGLGA